MIELIKKIISFSPRQFEGEKRTRKLIENILIQNREFFDVQEFDVEIPSASKWWLSADGKDIKCLPCSFVSGKIDSDYVFSKPFEDTSPSKSVIVFNPKSDAICLHTFHNVPSVAVSRKDIEIIENASMIEGFVEVERISEKSANILVGNITNPKNIIFSHYDSIQTGAVDNASGTVVCLEFIKRYGSSESLFVFAGNEELSYDDRYWGFGYRQFQKKYHSIMDKAEKIIIVDGVGNSKTEVLDGYHELVPEGFPINNIERYKNKINFIAGNFNILMEYYHSDKDDISRIKIDYLEESLRIIRKIIREK